MPALYVLGSRPSSLSQPSLVCQVAMPWARPEDEGWRASRNPESRCSGTPPFNVQAVRVDESEGGAARALPGAALLGGPVDSSKKEERGCHRNYQPAVSC